MFSSVLFVCLLIVIERKKYFRCFRPITTSLLSFLCFTCVFFRGSTVQALNTTFGDQDAGILGFLPNISIVIFDAFQVYLQLQLTNFKITEVTLNSKPNLHWLFVSIY